MVNIWWNVTLINIYVYPDQGMWFVFPLAIQNLNAKFYETFMFWKGLWKLFNGIELEINTSTSVRVHDVFNFNTTHNIGKWIFTINSKLWIINFWSSRYILLWNNSQAKRKVPLMYVTLFTFVSNLFSHVF